MSPACMPGAPYVARTGARSAETGRSSIGLLHPYSPTEPEPGKASIVGPEVDKLTARLKSPKPTSATSPSTPTRPARSPTERPSPHPHTQRHLAVSVTPANSLDTAAEYDADTTQV